MRFLLCLTILVVPVSIRAQTIGSQDHNYPQLVSTRYARGSKLPDGVKQPTPSFDFVNKAGLPVDAKVLSAAKSASGRIWVVTEKGAFRSEGNGFEPIVKPQKPRELNEPPILPEVRVVAVTVDRLGHIWAATTKGLLVTDGEDWWQPITCQDGVPIEAMTCLELTANGDVWGGTSEGAWRMRNGQFRYFWGRRWLPGNRVKAIWTDDKGRAWIETDGGYACIEEKPTTLAQKAAHFDAITQARHMRRGFISEIHLKVPGDPSQGARWEVSDNDGLWNSIYVGAMACRYAATQDPVARKQAREALEAMLELERLTGISGYPARAVVTDEELKRGIDGVNLEETVRVPNETDKIWFRSPVDRTVWCKGDTSSDEMDGHYFAWYLYYDLVADDSEKQKIAGIVRRATNHILEHNYTLVGHTGRKTRWGIWTPELIEHDPRYNSLRPLNSLEILAYLAVAQHITGDAKYGRAYEELIQKHHYLLNTLLLRRGRIGRWSAINHSDDEMLYMMYYCILRLEKDPDRRRILGQSIARTWEGAPGEQSVRLEHSPLYNFIYGATTGRPCDADKGVQTLQDWPWDMIHWSVKNSQRSDVQFKTDVGGGRRRRQPELDCVLPASERRLARWNGNPWSADGGGEGRSEDDGAAWSLAYWLGVYHGFVPKEENEKQDRIDEDFPAFIKLEELKVLPTDSKLTQLYKQRQNAARDAIESRFKEWVAGRGTQAFLIRSAEDLLTFRLDLASSDEGKLAIRSQLVQFATVLELLTRERYEAGRVATQDLKQVEYFLLDAKIDHMKARDRIKKR